ncbi:MULTISPECIES: EamA family transporter [unclassified Pseudoalteromonas]|uniref:DMT family transporter n=1 Tax=unclassified Pseudoalteromonas TaxID=194690 RepID=UPI00110BD02E|nr:MULTISPECIES: EamA family transporter [unclassified Pseudoalteromonas]TMP44429.1 EamA family transporter [Pseudoalteromonas sp. S1650]TMP65031.1 EamA family transporter [Pseudoalteromonas sp. S1649]
MNHTIATIAVLVASVFWGTTGTAASFAPDISPFAIGAFAMGFGGVLLCLTSLTQLINNATALRKHYRLTLLGSACVAIYPLAFYTSMNSAGVAIGTVVSIASAPLFTVLLEYLIEKKPISTRWLVSFCFGAIGIGLIASSKEHNLAAKGLFSQNIGIILGLIAGLTYAGYSWVAKRLISYGIHSRATMASLFGGAACVLLPSLLITGDALFATVTNTSVALYMAIVPMFLGYWLFSIGLKTIAASQAVLITLLEPIIATVLAIVILNEQFQQIGWLGIGLVSISLVIQTVNIKQFVIHCKKRILTI